MSDRQRHRAFAFAAVVVIGMCGLAWLLERPHGGGEADAGRKTASQRPLVLSGDASAPSSRGPATATQQPGPRFADSVVPEGAEIERVAARFAGAFVRYQVGQLPLGVRREIEATTTLEFGASLLGAPPRVPNAARPPTPAELRSVALANGPGDGKALVAIELNGASGQIETLNVLMARSGQEWRVSGLA